MNIEPEFYDLTGLKCPLPVLKTRARLRNMNSGDAIWVQTTDPLAVIDVPHFCTEDGHELREMTECGDKHRFLIVKGG